ncbi:hypothetical protein ES708_25522 [subsurface metagenome]
MAKPKNPLLSLGARGTIADTLTFQKRGRGHFARKKPVPKDPRSPAQLAWRQLYRDTVAVWNALTPEEQQAWRGVCPGLTAYQCFMRSELKFKPPEFTLFEYYNTGDDNHSSFYGAIWQTQTFTPSTAHRITTVKLLLHRVGSPGELIVSIRATDTETGHPTGGDLCSGTTDGDTLPSPPGEWREITFGDGYDLAADIKYAIVIRAPDGNGLNVARWRFDSTDPTYTEGNFERSLDSGVGWTSYIEWDTMFEDWGYPL